MTLFKPKLTNRIENGNLVFKLVPVVQGYPESFLSEKEQETREDFIK